jgi:NAD(P)-dependent dehydrogenase (short-subunit alcohol dehydrogenase family)
VKVPFFLVAELAPAMAARGKGAIINVTTMVAQFGQVNMALYGASKAALVLLTKSWAAEFGPSGVRVNAVSPGPTRTEGTAPMGDALDQLASTSPGRRPGLPEEIASAIAFLAGDEAVLRVQQRQHRHAVRLALLGNRDPPHDDQAVHAARRRWGDAGPRVELSSKGRGVGRSPAP